MTNPRGLARQIDAELNKMQDKVGPWGKVCYHRNSAVSQGASNFQVRCVQNDGNLDMKK